MLPLLSGERMLDRTPGENGKPASAAQASTKYPADARDPATPSCGSWHYVLAEMGQVIRIRKVDDANALLLSGDQGWFLRENVKLRLLNARLALLSRNEPVFRNDLAAAQALISAIFRYPLAPRAGRADPAQAGAGQRGLGARCRPWPSLGALRALKKE